MRYEGVQVSRTHALLARTHAEPMMTRARAERAYVTSPGGRWDRTQPTPGAGFVADTTHEATDRGYDFVGIAIRPTGQIDAGSAADAGVAVAPSQDAGTRADAGSPTRPPDAGPIDAGPTDAGLRDAGLPPAVRPTDAGVPATITSRTVAATPTPRTRTTIGVGEQVDLTHSAGSTNWATTAGTLSVAVGATTRLTAPATASAVTVTGGRATITLTVRAPSSVHMDRYPGTGIRHAAGRPDSGIQTQPFLGPDTVNFYRVRYREVDVAAVCSGVYSPFAGVGHDAAPATVPLSDIVTAGKGTQAHARDSIYSGDPGTRAPFAPGAITYSIPYEYTVGAGPYHRFATVTQRSDLGADAVTLSSSKAGAVGTTTVGSPTSTY
jgi:hypothetical protein